VQAVEFAFERVGVFKGQPYNYGHLFRECLALAEDGASEAEIYKYLDDAYEPKFAKRVKKIKKPAKRKKRARKRPEPEPEPEDEEEYEDNDEEDE
jgi:hypothetical protein